MGCKTSHERTARCKAFGEHCHDCDDNWAHRPVHVGDNRARLVSGHGVRCLISHRAALVASLRLRGDPKQQRCGWVCL